MSEGGHGGTGARAHGSAPNCVQPPGRAESTRALVRVLGLTVLVMLVEVVGGLLSRSLALLADAAHMLTDAGALALSLFAAWIARRPAPAAKTYGYYRLEILAALLNGSLLIALTVWIVLEAVQRLGTPEPVEPRLMLAVATLGLAANLVGVIALGRSKGENLNVRGAYLHVLGDLLGSVGTIAAGAVILLTGWLPADPLISLGIAALILVSAARLVWESVDVLLEATPRHVSLQALEAAIAAVPGVRGVHDLHVWTVSSGIVAMSGHATVPDPTDHQGTLEEICRRVRTFGIQHVTIQLEREVMCEG